MVTGEMNTPSSVEEFLNVNKPFNSILNALLLKTSNVGGTKFVTMSQIRMNAMPQVRVGIVGQ